MQYVLLLVGFVLPALFGHIWAVSQQLGLPGVQASEVEKEVKGEKAKGNL